MNSAQKKSAVTLNNEIPFPDELEHLADIRHKLEEALCAADSRVERMDKEYMDEKRYMVQNRGEIDPQEMFQNELALKQIDKDGAFAVEVRGQITKLKDSPYFARIDFRTGQKKEAKSYYIGRFPFSHQNKLLIFDWRAPISGMFYDCEVGSAGYNAPMGRIDGELTRKRQFRIQNGKMEYALETSANIQDDVLQRELSHTSDEKMKSIIATIQKEQNQIIRKESTETLIIQGVAGSGKTSIALHRVAFLLYRYRNSLSSKNVAILSPNQVFGDYISSVLPELGEEPVCELSFSEIAETQLNGIIRFETERDPLEVEDEPYATRVRFKSTLEFVKKMDIFLEDMPAWILEPADYISGRFTAKADFIQERFRAYSMYSVKRRLKLIADEIHDQFTANNFMEEVLPSPKAIFKNLDGMLKIKNTLALYQEFYRRTDASELFRLSAERMLEWADVYPFLYFHAAMEGLQEDRVTRHLVVDEMQDYTPVQFAVLNRLFPCPKTILGDFGQFMNPNHQNTLADLRSLYHQAGFVELNISYRSTYEIMNFAKQIQMVTRLEPIVRHGEEPDILQCKNKKEEIALIGEMIEAFKKSGYTSLGIITKTNREAKLLFDAISGRYTVHLLSAQSSKFENGVSVASIQMSKGLEFDEVIVVDADGVSYSTDYDRCLLYIACTRAMHRLSLTYTGKLSPLVNGKSRK